MIEPDPEAQERLAVLSGEHGSEEQFTATLERTKEIIAQRMSLHRIITGPGVNVTGVEQPFIFVP